MKNSHKNLTYWKHPEYGDRRAKIEIDYLDNARPIHQFLLGDVQSEWSCSDLIKRIDNVLDNKCESSDSFGNCCTIIIKKPYIHIENEYTKETSENLEISDLKIILENWLEFIKTKEPIEYRWL